MQLSILLFIISLCAGEFYLSITHDDAFAELRAWGQRKAWMTGFQSQENHSWHAAYAEYSTDRYGFRRNTIVPDWDDGDSELVFVVGGSSAFGYGLNDRETWAEHLQQGLNEHGPGPAVSVVNAGNNAFNSLQVLMRFYNDVLPHSPAVVVFYENRNDYSGRILSTEDILFSGTMHDYVVRIKRDKSLYERTLLFYFAEKAVNSWFGSSAHIDRGVQDASPIVERNPEVASYAERQYRKHVTTLIDVCRRHECEVVLMTFLHDAANFGNQKFSSAGIVSRNKVLREVARAEDVLLVDLDAAFTDLAEKESYFFEDAYHPNVKGATFIARKALNPVRRALEKALQAERRE